MVITLLITLASFAIIVLNIIRHHGGDRDGILLIQNFFIALLGCGALFWHWGYLPSTEASVEHAPQKCSDTQLLTRVQSIALCMRSPGCVTTPHDTRKVIEYLDQCQETARVDEVATDCARSEINPLTDKPIVLVDEECQ